ncbi:MAG: hypothetical protein ABI353_01070 [Isosphaeraceae bacterium]
MTSADDHTKIAGIYDFGPGEGDETDITFAEARRQKETLRDKLSSFDELDYGRIWFLRGGEFFEGFMPLSLCGFVWWATANAAEFVSEGVIWLMLCEAEAVLLCSSSEVTVQVWTAIPTAVWEPHFGRELPHAYSFWIKFDYKNLPPIRSEMRFELTISLRDWLIGVQDLGRDYRALLLDVKEWVYANPSNFLSEQDRQQVEEAFAFCEDFPGLENKINALLEEITENSRSVENGQES